MADIKTFQQLMTNRRYTDAVALGLVAGVDPEVKFGHIPNAATSVIADIWENGLAQPIYLFPPDAGDLIEIFSAATDTLQITIEGLDAAGVLQTDTLTLSGTIGTAGAVASAKTWRAVNRAYNSDATELTGAVTVRKVGDAARVYALIDTDDQQTSQAVYVVPAGKIALINNFSTAINKSGGATISGIYALKVRNPGKVFRTQIRYGLQREGVSNISSDLIVPVLTPPLAQIKVSALPDATPTDISGEFSMWLIDEGLVPAGLLAAISG